MTRLIIPGRLPGLNEYITAERSKKYAGARMRKKQKSVLNLQQNPSSGACDLKARSSCTTPGSSRTESGTRTTSLLQKSLCRTRLSTLESWKMTAGIMS